MDAKGKIIIAAGSNVWQHEMDTARALAGAGRTVEFVRRSEEKRTTSADVLMDGELWEMKAPKSDKARRVIRTLRDALHQSRNVIFDSRRMSKVPDAQIEHELRKGARELRSLRHLVFVNRKGKVIDIK
ncbi:hypothetical protein [Adlercreutzia sp. ZJ305]|nr:hypothetical protein [Adlercreutzia sp. ZJ305]